MKFFIILVLSVSIVAAETAKTEGKSKQSKRTGRQFGWQTPFTATYNYAQDYGQKNHEVPQSMISNPLGSKSPARVNSKITTHSQAASGTVDANKQPLIESLKLKPSKVSATLTVAPNQQKSTKPAVLPSYSTKMPQYPAHNFYGYNGFPNYLSYHQQPTQNLFGREPSYSNPIISSQNPSSGSLYETSNPNYLGASYNTDYGQYIMPLGHPSFGVQGQYAPSGGLQANYNYYSNPMMAIGNRPINDMENHFENTILENFQFECPVDFSAQSHVVGQATIYPDPIKCNRFYYCQSGHAYVFQCSDDMYYNPAIKACDEKQYFSCGNRAMHK